MKYPQLESYEPVFLAPDEDAQLACCDCGLVHLMQFIVIDKDGEQRDEMGIAIRFIRKQRATGQLRRHKYGGLHKGVRGWTMRRLK